MNAADIFFAFDLSTKYAMLVTRYRLFISPDAPVWYTWAALHDRSVLAVAADVKPQCWN